MFKGTARLHHSVPLSKLVVEVAPNMLSTRQSLHRPLSGCHKCAPSNCPVGTQYWIVNYGRRRGVLIYLATININCSALPHNSLCPVFWWGNKYSKSTPTYKSTSDHHHVNWEVVVCEASDNLILLRSYLGSHMYALIPVNISMILQSMRW